MNNESNMVNKLLKSYSENIGFIVFTAEELQKLYQSFGIDPKSTNRAIFDLEGISHHLQSEVVKLIKMMNITQNDLTLDVGCGNGAPARLIAKLCGCKMIGVDINPTQIKKAIDIDRLEGLNHLIERVVKDVHKLDFEQESFDKIFFNETMCHWYDKKTALARLFNVLKKGGIMGFHEWLRGDKGDLNDAGGPPGIYENGVWFQNTFEETRTLLENAGFTIIISEDTTDTVDRGLRATLREVEMSKSHYINSGLEDHFHKTLRYCQVMVETDYDYLKYARFLCAKK